MDSRERILTRVKEAVAGARSPEVPRDYDRQLPADTDLVALLVERITDYHADVQVIEPAALSGTIGSTLAQYRATSVVVPSDLPSEWLTTVTCQVLTDDGSLSATDLDSVHAVITSSAVSVALTGTIVLDAGPGQGRRVISLVPDLHICVVDQASIVGSIPEAVGRLDPVRPLTWISGPSATSDIELNRIEGVHGPRHLVVLITH